MLQKSKQAECVLEPRECTCFGSFGNDLGTEREWLGCKCRNGSMETV